MQEDLQLVQKYQFVEIIGLMLESSVIMETMWVVSSVSRLKATFVKEFKEVPRLAPRFPSAGMES
jgi:hypothetical protein